MNVFQQVLFLIVLGITSFILFRRIRQIKRNIAIGKKKEYPGSRKERLKNVILIAFGQKKMFKRPIPAFLHFLIYIGFLVINLEVLEFVIDGLLGTHRIFAPYLGSSYNVLMNVFEFLAIVVIIACCCFLIRRNLLRVKRFWSNEMTLWPKLDANIILFAEIVLMMAILTMNASDQVLQSRIAERYHYTGTLFFSAQIMPIIDGLSTGALIVIERAAWWFHIIGILAFMIYITYSKHLHIFMAFPNTYFANLEPKGKILNMPVVTQEVRSMLGLETVSQPVNIEAGRFGAKDIHDLSRNNLMAAYACTECGRCTSECPANITGKKLSPRKIMMDVRDRMEDTGKNLSAKMESEDGKSLLDGYITREEINACTSCNACVEACPVMINPLEIILELKRYVAMEESGSPASWNAMFQNIETNFAPWKFSPSDRFNWAKEIDS